MIILVLIGMVFAIIWKMFHGKISLNSVLLLLLVKFVSGFTLELMYKPLIENIRSTLTNLHSYWHFLQIGTFLNTGKSVVPPIFHGPEVLSATSSKAKLFADNFHKNSNIHD